MNESESPRVDTILSRIGRMGGEAYSAVGHRNAIRSDTGLAFQSIVSASRPGTILEMGTAYGFSTSVLALGIPSACVHTVEFDEGSAS